MSKTFIGKDGHYEIDDNGGVVQKVVDQFGKCTGKIREYRNAKHIPNPFDRDNITNFLKLLKIYKFGGRC